MVQRMTGTVNRAGGVGHRRKRTPIYIPIQRELKNFGVGYHSHDNQESYVPNVARVVVLRRRSTLLEETYGSAIEMGTLPKECNADPKP